jgi:hypothetical protein
LVSEHNFVIAIPQYPVLQGLRGAQFHDLDEQLFEELSNCFGVVEAELIKVDSFLVGYALFEVLEDFSGAFVAGIVEDDVYGLL